MCIRDRLEGVRTWTTPKSKVLGLDSFKGMGIDFGDLDGNGLLDMYVSNIAGEYSLEESHFAFVNTGRTDQMACLLYTSPSPRDRTRSRMPSSA